MISFSRMPSHEYSTSIPYPGSMTCRSNNVDGLQRSAAFCSASSALDLSSVVGAPGRKVLRTNDLTRLFQGTKTRAVRGFRPLNSNRWRGASRRANGPGVIARPVSGASAGQPVVQADHRRLQSDASVRLISCSAA